MKAAIVAAALMLAGCVSVEQQAQNLAPQHDAFCKSYGTKPGSPEYAQCRMFLYAQLQKDHTERRRLMNEGLDDIIRAGQSYEQSRPRSISCSRTLMGGVDCTSF